MFDDLSTKKTFEPSLPKYVIPGFSLIALKRYDEAIRCFDEAIKIKPDLADAHAGKGFSLAMTGQHKEAMKCFEEAIRLNPDLADAYV